MNENLKDRWESVWQKLNAHAVPQEVFEELLNAYSAANRFYHNLIHIEDCLSIFDETKSLCVHPEEVELAIWFHDAVYDTTRNDNEQKSAEWAVSAINQSGVNHAVSERVSNLVLATRHMMAVSEREAQLIVDVDLSILGSEADFYWQYENNIRREYAWVPESIFREKRREILQRFLGRRYIYYHQTYRDRFERQARQNLEHAITKLSKVS